MRDMIVKSIDYAVERDGQDIALVVTVEGVRFREETIPDGAMAGMKGHREIPYENVMRFPIHPDQAQLLIAELERVVQRR